MSATIDILPPTLKNLLILGLVAIALGSTASPLHADRSCASIVPLVAGETWRDPGSDAGDTACFDLDLAADGVLMVEVSAAATAAPVRLSRDQGATAASRLRQSATSLVLAARAGSHRLRVEAEDPRQPLPTFVLRSRFLAGAKGETDSETEIDPDPVVAPGDKGETDSETEIDPDPLAGDPVASLHDLSAPLLGSRLGALCRQGEVDDHGDGFACATALVWGKRASGEIGNGWGDDGDVFRFRVKALGAVEIEAGGDSELVAELYDRHGQRLDLAVGGGDGLRRVRTLAPGVYFLRLEGRDGGAGRYSLAVGPASR